MEATLRCHQDSAHAPGFVLVVGLTVSMEIERNQVGGRGQRHDARQMGLTMG